MRFTYTYRSSDGQRHTAEIEAESRDAAFTRVRTELGIKPIKVTAVEGESRPDSGSTDSHTGGSRFRATVWGAAILVAVARLVGGGMVWWRRSTNNKPQTANHGSPAANGESQTVDNEQPITVATPQGPVVYTVAKPLPRQAIPGDRKRLSEAMNGLAAHSSNTTGEPPIAPVNGQNARSPRQAKSPSTGGAFRFAAEAWLARFAEPGRISFIAINETNGGKPPVRPSEAEFAACLKEPIYIASTDFTEIVDLKRIVTGIKREMNAYLVGGGTVDGYLAELEKRQKLEVSYRERAERRLNALLAAAKRQDARPTGGDLKAAYDYWLKANAQLQVMGIYPLALPDSLRSYQMSLDIDE